MHSCFHVSATAEASGAASQPTLRSCHDGQFPTGYRFGRRQGNYAFTMSEREFPLTGWTVERIAFDYQTTLSLYPPTPGTAADCTVTLMGAFCLRRPNREGLELEAGPPFENAEAILELHRLGVARFAASDEGRLTITFDDGSVLEAARDDQYESWQTHGAVSMLCSPHPGPPWGAA